MENNSDLWIDVLPRRSGEGHKYDYGHALIYAAPALTGATRLAAEACARIGAGLTTVVADSGVADIYRAALPAHIMVRDDLAWHDDRVTARLYGPGGLPEFSGKDLRFCGDSNVGIVLDADALQNLPAHLDGSYVLTPHEGEFARTFPDISGSKEEKALAAAKRCGAVVLLKGAETVIAHPDGRVVTNRHASPYLATAGSGDVLSGMITGLLAQGMPLFEAACAAVWIHGDAAMRFGPGLVASDLPDMIPQVLQEFA